MTDTSKLQNFVLLITLIAMVIGVGILTLDKFGAAMLVSTTATGETLTASNSTFVALDNRPVESITTVINSSNASDIVGAANITFSSKGVKIADNRFNAVTNGVNVTYVYGNNVSASTSVFNSRDALATISSDWLSLIITISILAIIIGLIMSSFAFRRR